MHVVFRSKAELRFISDMFLVKKEKTNQKQASGMFSGSILNLTLTTPTPAISPAILECVENRYNICPIHEVPTTLRVILSPSPSLLKMPKSRTLTGALGQ